MKKLGLLAFFVGVFFLMPQPVFAEELCPSAFSSLCKVRFEKGGGIIGVVMSTMITIAIVACLFFLVLGAIKWMTSGGDETKVKAARSTLIAALVGMVISIASFFIVNVVLTLFTGQGLEGLKIPKLI